MFNVSCCKTLLMRKRALAKRRKTVEELLQWHKKLLNEERAIEELETKTRTVAIHAQTQEDERESQRVLEYIPQSVINHAKEEQVEELVQPKKEKKSVDIADSVKTKNDRIVQISSSLEELTKYKTTSILKNGTEEEETCYFPKVLTDVKLLHHTKDESVSLEQLESPKLQEWLAKEKSSILTEAKELHRKQLAIEQEIKLLKEQQQKSATSFYLREIPDKPPPPYTPPLKSKTTPSIIPKTKEECEHIIEYCVKIIHKAYVSGNLTNVTISAKTLSLIAKDIDKSCYKFIFDLCKEVATNHYSQFAEVAGPSCLQKPITLASPKPLDIVGLKMLMLERVLTQLGFHQGKPKIENSIIKWSRKKRDQVEEVLVQEMQRDDATWTNLELDSTLVQDRMVNELMKIVVQDTVTVFKQSLLKKLEKT